MAEASAPKRLPDAIREDLQGRWADPSTDWRQRLRILARGTAPDPIIQQAATDEDWRVRYGAIEWLRDRKTLSAMLQDPHSWVRAGAQARIAMVPAG